MSEHCSAEANAKTHQFWAYRSFINDFAMTAEEYDITAAVQSEAYTMMACPSRGDLDSTKRQSDVFRCHCGYEGHADLGASRTFPHHQTNGEVDVRPMVRPVRLPRDN